MKRNSSECNDDSDFVGPSSEFQNRRKRRGMIEKKRRDRINESLIELQHLVPMAKEKKGTSKLEKAELLEMTVNHMKSLLQANKTPKGNSNAITFPGGADTNNNPLCNTSDYKAAGFMKCATEIDNFLASMEGFGKENPSRYRLVKHLDDCYTKLGSQRSTNASVGTAITTSNMYTNPIRPMTHIVTSSIPTINTASHYRGIVPTAATPPYTWFGTSNINLPIIPVRLPDGSAVCANSLLHSSVALSPTPMSPLFGPVPQPVRFSSVPSVQTSIESMDNMPN